jgi:DNA-binding IclR family transcriptional regulator
MATQEPQGMLSKGLILLDALGEHPQGITVTDMAREVGLAVSTVHRLLQSEIHHGYVSFDAATKTYRLGMRIFELATRVSSVTSISDAARPIMRELSQTTRETVQLSVLSRNHALFIEKIGTEQPVGIRGAIGDSEPLHATSTGKILLSQLDEPQLTQLLDQIALEPWSVNTITDRGQLLDELEQVRARGYAMANEEYDSGVRALGVPVRNGRGEVRAALCISAPVFRVSQETLLGWLPDLQQAAHAIGIRLPVNPAA